MVYTNHRPNFLLIKRIDTLGFGWYIMDATRSPYNVVAIRLSPNDSSAEASSPVIVDFLSNGFKIRDTNGAWNASGGTYIFASFAEFPFKYSRAY
jgi:hypothetical protein